MKIINHSGGDVWDGPGDGTSDFVSDERRSLLNIVKDAEDGGAVWVNAAGNSALQTWYSTFVPFNRPVEGIQYLDFSSIRYSYTGGNNPCNRVTLEAGKSYVLQTRWDGDWDGDDVDLEVHLVREAGTDGEGNPLPRLMVSSTGHQAGPGTDPPFEKLEFSTGEDDDGDYCVLITRDSGDRVLGWLQFQIFAGGGDVNFHTQTGSVTNPAESASGGMLAVGAGKFEVVLPEQLPPAPTPFPTAVVDLWDYSARGPVPEIPAHVKPELVGINTDLLGTSDAAPQVAGVAALVAQVSGYSVSPRHLVQSLFDHRDGGAHGLVQLPSLEAPTGVTVSHDTCLGRGPGGEFLPSVPWEFAGLVRGSRRASSGGWLVGGRLRVVVAWFRHNPCGHGVRPRRVRRGGKGVRWGWLLRSMEQPAYAVHDNGAGLPAKLVQGRPR